MSFELRPGIRRLFRLHPRHISALHRDIDDELETLIANRVEHLVAHGLSPDAARVEALRRLGSTLDEARQQLHQSAEHRERRMHLREHIENLVQDIRYAARGLARRPGFTAVAVLTLAIGIGATTAIFSAVNVLLLRALPYENPDQLMRLTLVTPARGTRPGIDDMVWSYPKYTVMRDNQRSFSDVALYGNRQFTFGATDPERIIGEEVGARYFQLLGVAPMRGRAFEASIDSVPGGAPKQAILSYSLWDRRFNADPSIVGKTVEIDRQPWRVIGIAPRQFKGLSGSAEVFVPITANNAAEDLREPQSHSWWAVGRRKAGVSAAQAVDEMRALGARIDDAFPNTFDHAPWSAKATPLDDVRLAQPVKQSLLVLFGAVGFVLLIACVNVANLLLARAATRRREIAVRLAIGAGRSRLMRLLVTESLLLAFLSGIASVAVAAAGVRALNVVNPGSTLRMARDTGFSATTFTSIHLDWTALAFTFGLAMIVGLLFGLAPAMSATRVSVSGALKDDSPHRRRVSGGVSRRMLVVAEVALAIVLLAGSGLMLRSLTKLLATNPGFDGHGVLSFRLNVPPGAMQRDSMPQFFAQLIERVGAVPGVEEAATANCIPLNGGCNATGMIRLDRPKVDWGQAPLVFIHWASPTWFSTLRVPLERGRVFTTADRAGAPKVVVLNDVAATTLFPGENPIGKHVELGQGRVDDGEIIGIVGGVRQQADSAPKAEVYISYLQAPRPGMVIYARTKRDPATIGPEIRRAVHEIAPTFPIYDMQTMDVRTAAATGRQRFSAMLLALFAATALSLAAIGIYGVMSLAVSARTRELGIRMALGADRRRVQRLVIGEGMSLVAAGALFGIVAALFATRVMTTMLYDLTPTDPATYVGVGVVLILAAVLASWIPARRAARVDPVVALRAE